MDTTAILIATLSGGLALFLVQEITSWLKGRKSREAKALAARDEAVLNLAKIETELDQEKKDRRGLEEYAHELRRQLLKRGVAISDLPPWPRNSARK